jgi:hypothetical protein
MITPPFFLESHTDVGRNEVAAGVGRNEVAAGLIHARWLWG